MPSSSLKTMTTDEYLHQTEESNRHRELRMSRVSEPPAPYFSHQQLVLKVARVLSDHVEPRRLGSVAVAPVDVILDPVKHLVLQPDVLFISTERLSIVRNQVWGPPDLIVEVFSDSTKKFDRGDKLDWYREYGVRECWLVDLYGNSLTIFDFTAATPIERVSAGPEVITSSVLPGLQLTAYAIFF
jgi:Uma2 family endonuclease